MKRYGWLLIPLLLAGCQPRPKTASHEAIAPKVVSLGEARHERVSERLSLNGTVSATSEVKIVPKLQGRVLSVLVEEGDRIRKGQLLATIETPELEWQLRQQQAAQLTAEATLEKARTDFGRMSLLLAEGAISQQQHDASRTQLTISEAQLQQLKAAISQIRTQIDHGRLTAPFAGTVVTRFAEVGAMAAPGTPMFTLAEAGGLTVQVQVPEQELAKLALGSPATVHSTAFPGRSFAGRIRRVNPAVNPQTRLIAAEIDLGSSDLRIGMFVQVLIESGAHSGVVVPVAALQTEGDSSYVFVPDGAHAKRLPVRTGLRMDDRIELLSGLPSGARVVATGSAFLSDGDPIALSDPQP